MYLLNQVYFTDESTVQYVVSIAVVYTQIIVWSEEQAL